VKASENTHGAVHVPISGALDHRLSTTVLVSGSSFWICKIGPRKCVVTSE
jgi:hypothetical protein